MTLVSVVESRLHAFPGLGILRRHEALRPGILDALEGVYAIFDITAEGSVSGFHQSIGAVDNEAVVRITVAGGKKQHNCAKGEDLFHRLSCYTTKIVKISWLKKTGKSVTFTKTTNNPMKKKNTPTELRVASNSERLKRAEEAIKEAEKGIGLLLDAWEDICILNEYMDSGEWLADFEADERGEISKTIPRGVLSEDALYNTLDRLQDILSQMSIIVDHVDVSEDDENETTSSAS
jgi:hypothetical protein